MRRYTQNLDRPSTTSSGMYCLLSLFVCSNRLLRMQMAMVEHRNAYERDCKVIDVAQEREKYNNLRSYDAAIFIIFI